MPIRFHSASFEQRRVQRLPLLGALAILTLLIASCYPFQEDFVLLLTPIAPLDPEAISETAAAQEMVTLQATAAVSALRVRREASAETPIIAGLIEGDVLPVIGRTADGNWLQVQVPDVETIGWILTEEVMLDGDAATLLVTDGDEDMAEDAIAEEKSDEDMAEETTAAEEKSDEDMAEETTAAEEKSDDAMAEETAAEEKSDDAMAEETTAVEEKSDDAMAEETAVAEEKSDDAMAADELSPSVTVNAQDVIEGRITIVEVVAQEKGWIVVHADDAGSFGAIIGQASVEPGVTTDLAVNIDVDAATEGLYAMLHVDSGVLDVFEFPGPDVPVLEDGAPISPAFAVTSGAMSMSEEDADEEGAGEETMSEKSSTEMTLLSEGDVATQLAIITPRSLRVRSKPETISEVLAGVSAGEVYPVAGFSADEEWVAIFFPDIDDPVWVSTSLVELRDTELKVQMGRATVFTGQGLRLRLRSEPSLDAPIVGHILSGHSFPILGISLDGAWALLVSTEVDGLTWASTDFLLIE